jgi:hypothetical protein
MFKRFFNKFLLSNFYKKDQDGIIKRYINEEHNWDIHINNSKNYILDFLANQHNCTVAILGSGWLIDVPMADILRNNNNIVLFDINHPKQIKNRYKNNNSVTFIEQDLTNGLIQKAINSDSFSIFQSFVNSSKPLLFNDNYDFIISLNLLNQLDIILCDLIKYKFNISDENLVNIRKDIQNLHIKSLPKNKSCIITDFIEINYSESLKDGIENNLLYVDLSFLKNTKKWLWTFDTKKNYRNNTNTTFKVIAGMF